MGGQKGRCREKILFSFLFQQSAVSSHCLKPPPWGLNLPKWSAVSRRYARKTWLALDSPGCFRKRCGWPEPTILYRICCERQAESTRVTREWHLRSVSDPVRPDFDSISYPKDELSDFSGSKLGDLLGVRNSPWQLKNSWSQISPTNEYSSANLDKNPLTSISNNLDNYIRTTNSWNKKCFFL